MSDAADAPDYPRLLRSKKASSSFVRNIANPEIYDFDMLRLVKEGGSDFEYKALISAIKSKCSDHFVEGIDMSPYKSIWGDLSVQEPPLGDVVILQGVRVLVPWEFRKTVLVALHEFHQSADAMFWLAKSLVFWPTMKQDVQILFDKCNTCQVNRKAKLPLPPVGNMHFVNLEPMDSISLDYCTLAGRS